MPLESMLFVVMIIGAILLGINIMLFLSTRSLSTEHYQLVDKFINRSSRYYVVCACIDRDRIRTLQGFTTDHKIIGDITEADLDKFREIMLRIYPSYVSCEVVFFCRIKD